MTSPADLEAALRKLVQWYHPMSAETAATLEQAADFIAAVEQVRRTLTCPTCGGTKQVGAFRMNVGRVYEPCPENGGNCDGKVPIERPVATFNAVHGDWSWSNVLVGSSGANAVNGCRDHLRGIR